MRDGSVTDPGRRCGACGECQVDERRCLECNLFCRALGAGRECPGCGEPVLVAELAGQAAHTAGVRPPGSGGLAVGSATSAGGRVPTGGGISM